MAWSKSKRTIDLSSLCGQNVVEFYFSSTIVRTCLCTVKLDLVKLFMCWTN